MSLDDVPSSVFVILQVQSFITRLGGIIVGSFGSSEFQGLDSSCIVIDYMIHHHMDITGKERRELKWFDRVTTVTREIRESIEWVFWKFLSFDPHYTVDNKVQNLYGWICHSNTKRMWPMLRPDVAEYNGSDIAKCLRNWVKGSSYLLTND